MNSIFFNSRRDLGQKKLETFCRRRWVRAGPHNAAGKGKVGRDTVSLDQIGTF